jgi:hypothetical protein
MLFLPIVIHNLVAGGEVQKEFTKVVKPKVSQGVSYLAPGKCLLFLSIIPKNPKMDKKMHQLLKIKSRGYLFVFS